MSAHLRYQFGVLHNPWASVEFKSEFLRDISKIFPLRLCVSVLALPLRYPFIGVLDPRFSQRAIAEAKQIPETQRRRGKTSFAWS